MKQKKQILVAVLGATPQIITETLYGLHKQNQEKPTEEQFWPEEIHVLTTKYGKSQAILRLLNPVTDPHSKIEYSGQLARFCDIYQVPMPKLTAESIHVIPNAEGIEVDDARTAADQDALADFIMKAVAELTNDPNVQIHASIAGGRKTMGYYLGSAMGMFARIGDSLSHVLVDEDFEGLPNFYFPTLVDEVGENTFKKKAVNFKDAQVSLANIAFIRQRQILNKHALAKFSEANVLKLKPSNEAKATYLSYLDLVRYQNIGDFVKQTKDKPEALAKFLLDFDLPQAQLTVSHPELPTQTIDFSQNQLAFAFYAMVARQGHTGELAIRPLKDGMLDTRSAMLLTLEFLRMQKVSEPTLSQLKQFVVQDDLEAFRSALDSQNLKNKLISTVSPLKMLPSTFNKLIGEKHSASLGIDKQFIADRNMEILELMSEYYPKELLSLIKPTGVWQIDKEDRNSQAVHFYIGNKKANTAYGLWVKSQFID